MRCRPIHHSGWPLSICSSRTSRSARLASRRLGLGVLFAFRPYSPWFPTAFRRADLVSGLRKRTLAPSFVVARAVASSHCHCGASFELAGSLRHSYPSSSMHRQTRALPHLCPPSGCFTSLPAWQANHVGRHSADSTLPIGRQFEPARPRSADLLRAGLHSLVQRNERVAATGQPSDADSTRQAAALANTFSQAPQLIHSVTPRSAPLRFRSRR
jgi:hypothetical protein